MLYRTLLDEFPDGFYAYLAERRSDGAARAPVVAKLDDAEQVPPQSLMAIKRAEVLGAARLNDYAADELRAAVAAASPREQRALLPVFARLGAYSQAVRAGDTVYLSGQIGFDPKTLQLAEGIDAQIHRVFANLDALAQAAGLTLAHAVRMTVYLTHLAHFAKVNEIMAQYVPQPYPARAAIGVAALPRGALVEIDAILHAG